MSAEEFLGLRVAARALAGAVAGLFLVGLGRLFLGAASSAGAILLVLVAIAAGAAAGDLAPPLLLTRRARQRRAAIERLHPTPPMC